MSELTEDLKTNDEMKAICRMIGLAGEKGLLAEVVASYGENMVRNNNVKLSVELSLCDWDLNL